MTCCGKLKCRSAEQIPLADGLHLKILGPLYLNMNLISPFHTGLKHEINSKVGVWKVVKL